MRAERRLISIIIGLGMALGALAEAGETQKSVPQLLRDLKTRTKTLKFPWSLELFGDEDWKVGGYSVSGQPLIYWTCGDEKTATNRALILSAVHGDEITPVYFGFKLVKWIKANPSICEGKYIVVAPIVNPDGFLRYSRGTRTNFNKVDLNRNFLTPDWAINAHSVWKKKYSSLRRYYPGDFPGSEPETKFQEWLIENHKPVKILSVHAPLNILDYDGPADDKAINFVQTYIESCETLKKAFKKATPDLRLFAYGQFPGSLGNFAGKQRGIPTFTAELPTIRAEKASRYFEIMEKGTKVFLEHEIKDSPMQVQALSPAETPAPAN